MELFSNNYTRSSYLPKIDAQFLRLRPHGHSICPKKAVRQFIATKNKIKLWISTLQSNKLISKKEWFQNSKSSQQARLVKIILKIAVPYFCFFNLKIVTSGKFVSIFRIVKSEFGCSKFQKWKFLFSLKCGALWVVSTAVRYV